MLESEHWRERSSSVCNVCLMCYVRAWGYGSTLHVTDSGSALFVHKRNMGQSGPDVGIQLSAEQPVTPLSHTAVPPPNKQGGLTNARGPHWHF